MRTRTKILVGVGLLAAAVGLVMACNSAKPVLEASFVGYDEKGAVVLGLTNRAQAGRVLVSGVVLAPQSGTQVVTRIPRPLKLETLSVQFVPPPSPLRRRLQDVLSKIGIDIASPSFEVSVTLPPRDKPASPSPPP